MICYGISAYASNAMKSSNPHSGIYEADTARCLDINGGNPACNQGGVLVVTRRMSSVSYRFTETSPCLENAMGNGGNNIPMIMTQRLNR